MGITFRFKRCNRPERSVVTDELGQVPLCAPVQPCAGTLIAIPSQIAPEARIFTGTVLYEVHTRPFRSQISDMSQQDIMIASYHAPGTMHGTVAARLQKYLSNRVAIIPSIRPPLETRGMRVTCYRLCLILAVVFCKNTNHFLDEGSSSSSSMLISSISTSRSESSLNMVSWSVIYKAT